MTETVWKVVYDKDEDYYSAFTIGPWFLKYTLGQKTTPNAGCIFAFNSLASAISWITKFNNPESLAILESEAGVADPLPETMSRCEVDFAAFWTGDRSSLITEPPPYGTVWCSWLTPLKKVWPES